MTNLFEYVVLPFGTVALVMLPILSELGPLLTFFAVMMFTVVSTLLVLFTLVSSLLTIMMLVSLLVVVAFFTLVKLVEPFVTLRQKENRQTNISVCTCLYGTYAGASVFSRDITICSYTAKYVFDIPDASGPETPERQEAPVSLSS